MPHLLIPGVYNLNSLHSQNSGFYIYLINNEDLRQGILVHNEHGWGHFPNYLLL